MSNSIDKIDSGFFAKSIKFSREIFFHVTKSKQSVVVVLVLEQRLKHIFESVDNRIGFVPHHQEDDSIVDRQNYL